MNQRMPKTVFSLSVADEEIAKPVYPLWASQLPAVNSEQLQAGNRLYNSAPLRFYGLTWHWCFSACRQPRYRLQFSAGNESLQLDLYDDIIGLDTQALDWLQFQEQPRLLAWTLMHEPFIQLLQAVLGLDWAVESIEYVDGKEQRENTIKTPNNDAAPNADSISTAASTAVDKRVNICFFVGRDDGLVLTRGEVFLPSPGVARITDRHRAKPTRLATCGAPNRRENSWWSTPISISWSIDVIPIAFRELQALRPGSLIRLDNRAIKNARVPVTIAFAENQWLGELEGLRIRIVAKNHSQASNTQLQTIPGGETDMNDNDSGSDYEKPNNDTGDNNSFENTTFDNKSLDKNYPDRSSSDTPSLDEGTELLVDGLMVDLRFEAGQMRLAFKDLNSVQPGYIFELDKKLEDRLITIYANEIAVARGQLVCINDLVGVRVTELKNHGLQ